jgi:hypothetical protein
MPFRVYLLSAWLMCSRLRRSLYRICRCRAGTKCLLYTGIFHCAAGGHAHARQERVSACSSSASRLNAVAEPCARSPGEGERLFKLGIQIERDGGAMRTLAGRG